MSSPTQTAMPGLRSRGVVPRRPDRRAAELEAVEADMNTEAEVLETALRYGEAEVVAQARAELRRLGSQRHKLRWRR